ncbi:MAG TPA: hypothetical protein VNT26_23045 [Candidatus Sulfotelmatobacter sp.]|nr:hypothetical protein [Candidatus Sulfotelmatobacter sp.]HWI59460.1 hypothetical protein [Bacillota bacterium]
MNKEIGKSLALGSTAGAAGTALIRGMLMLTQRFAPETLPPMKEDPGHFMVKQVERVLPEKVRNSIPEQAEPVAATLLAFGYGITWGLLYAALRPRGRNLLLEGATLGTATWAAGYLGWLPATRLTPPVWKQTPKQVVPNLLSHMLFGITTVALLKWAQGRLG